jgi:hypothetical protein
VLGVEKAKNFVKQRKDIRALLCYRKTDGTVESTRLNF